MTIKKQVEQVLNENGNARNNDNVLLMAYWKKFDDGKAITPATSIIRARQMLNSEGKCLPTLPKVIKQRRLKEKRMLEAVRQGEVI